MESLAAALKIMEYDSHLRMYNIKLRRRFVGQVSLECQSGPSTVVVTYIRTLKEVVALMNYLVRMGFGLGRKDVKHMAFIFVERSRRPHPF